MASAQVLDVKVAEENSDVFLAPNQSLTPEDKSLLGNSSFENSPLLDREKFLRYSARSQDEFWDALSSNYDYLMDDGLIATCREASSDLSLDDENELPEACFWSLTQFIEQFKWLHDLLHNIQVAKEGDNKSDTKILEEQQKVAYLCKLFNDQAQRLSKRYPDMRDEVHRHLNRLNNKWKAVEQSINPIKVKSPSKDCVYSEIANRMRSVRKWLREIEDRLITVNLAVNWTLESVEKRYKEQEELQKEIEVKGKCISSLLKLCEQLKGNVQFGQNPLMIWDSERVRKVAKNLEHRWHTIWLKSLECHYILENLMHSFSSDSDLEKSFSEEPLKKYPRLSGNCEELLLLENEIRESLNFKTEGIMDEHSGETSKFCDHVQQTDMSLFRADQVSKNDKGVMVGDTGIAELKAECQKGDGKFEIIQDVGYSSETSAHLSNDEKIDSPEACFVKYLENKAFLPSDKVSPTVSANCTNSSSKTINNLYLPPDKYPSISLKTLHILSDDKPLFNSRYGDCKAVPDSFYKVTSVDEELLDSLEASEKPVSSESVHTEDKDPRENFISKVQEVVNDVSSLKLDTSSETRNNTENAIDKIDKDSNSRNPDNLSYAISKRNKRGIKPSLNNKLIQPKELSKKSARIQQWLNTCQSTDDFTSDDNLDSPEKCRKSGWLSKATDSSCDASGEYTTTESDSERSNASDVNNSVTLSQSFTGSIETVIPVVQEEIGVVQSDRAGSIEPSPGVRMRKKKRLNRDRPWSVTDVHQSAFIASAVPHSISESALDSLYSAQDHKKNGSKKSSIENKRLSLTDVSSLSCPSIKSFKFNLNSTKNNLKANVVSEKLPSRRKKGSFGDKGADKSDSPCLASENISKHSADSKTSSSCKDTNEKNSSHEKNNMLESSAVSENEKSESAVNVEDQGSLSDQAWDEYQDPPYLSEPYSEQTADEDEVKKLINFGDDYRAVLGSYSDASSISLKAPTKTHRTRSKSSWRKGSSQESRDSLMSDSNSDSEDFHNVLRDSSRALQSVSNTLKENTQKMSTFSSEFAELVATCQTNLCHLHAIHNELVSGCELESLSKEDFLKLQDLIKEWEALQVKLLTHSRNDNKQKPISAEMEAATIDVHCSLAALKEKLSAIATNINDAGEASVSLSQLKSKIKNLQTGLSNLQETKESVLSVSARILRLIAEGGGPTITSLRDSATKLYQQWEDVYELNCSQLTKLQGLESRWHESTESEMNSSSETTVQWHPVQVGDSLPTPQVSTEDFFHNTAAEIQMAGHHDALFDIQTESSSSTTIQCFIENEKEDFSDPIHLLSPPTLQIESLEDEKSAEGTDVEGPVSNSKKSSCFWRTLRATVPIQFALVILYCMSSLMEPHCCENMNNYDFSLFPHLRYMRGPPPV